MKNAYLVVAKQHIPEARIRKTAALLNNVVSLIAIEASRSRILQNKSAFLAYDRDHVRVLGKQRAVPQ